MKFTKIISLIVMISMYLNFPAYAEVDKNGQILSIKEKKKKEKSRAQLRTRVAKDNQRLMDRPIQYNDAKKRRNIDSDEALKENDLP